VKINVTIFLPIIGLAGWWGCAMDEGAPSATGGETTNMAPSDPSYSYDGAETGAPTAQAAGRAAPAPSPSAEPPEDRDQFEDVGSNPFVAPGHDPFSTFAADVDTASYDIFRQWMLSDQLSPGASVRLEEFINYFDYDYPAPAHDSETPFAISLAAAPHPFGGDTVFVRVGIQAQDPPPGERARANLVFLVDVSGSMSSNDKLPLVQELLTNAVNRLNRDDTIAIVTYAGGTSVALEPTPVSDSNTIVAAIQRLSSGGGTAGAAGIELAYAQAEAAFVEGGINHVLLCTDGDFNIGPSANDDLVELIEAKRRTGVTLTALGFGRGNLNDAMMEAVTNAGNGTYGVIYNEARAAEYIDEHLLPSMTFVAQDMKIQVEFNPEEVTAYRLLGYVNRAIADEDFRNNAVDAGEVGAGHRVTALYEVVLRDGVVPTPEGAPALDDGEPVEGKREIQEGELLQVKVRYKEVGASEEDSAFEVNSVLTPADVLPHFEGADDDFQWALAVAIFAEVLQGSPFADDADLETVRTVVTPQADRDSARGEFVDLLGRAIPLF
jgi:Ca-activated chloride channel family protein